jgi:CO/xanthine dehydrogenase FAD-binding subunit
VKASQFGYHRPGSLDEAVEILARYGSDARVLAGGQSLMPLLALRRARPQHLVDVQQLGELAGMGRADGLIRFGAMVRHRQIERDGLVPPLMRFAARFVGNIEVRNRGTLGGWLAFADPAAEWPAVTLAMEAVLVAVSVRGRREIAVQDFVRGAYATSLAADELLVEVLVPELDTGFGFAEVARVISRSRVRSVPARRLLCSAPAIGHNACRSSRKPHVPVSRPAGWPTSPRHRSRRRRSTDAVSRLAWLPAPSPWLGSAGNG